MARATNKTPASPLPSVEELGLEIFRKADNAGDARYAETKRPQFPFEDGLVERVSKALKSDTLAGSTPNHEEIMAIRKANTERAASVALILAQNNPREVIVEGVRYYPIETVALAALRASHDEIARSKQVLSSWRELYTADPLTRAGNVIAALSEHLGFDVATSIANDEMTPLPEVKK